MKHRKIQQISAKIENLQQINRNYRTEKYNKKCKILPNELNSRMLITEDRINDSKNRSMKLIWCEQQRDKTTKKKN